MPSEPAVEDKGPASEALAARVEGWVQYCEYFHLLDADMQRMSEVSAQRYSATGMWEEGECRVRATDHNKCFEAIVTKSIGRDRPLVEMEDESPDGSEGGLILDDGSGTAAGRRVLREADLTVVRSKLRAAAYSSNLRVAAEERLAGGLQPEPPLALGGMAPPRGKKLKAPSPSDTPTCAAAIETLLWFGLALGENSSRTGGSEGKNKCRGSISLSECCGGALDDFNLDCTQAMLEAGLTDEISADEALAAVRAIQESKGVVPKLETTPSLEPFSPFGTRPAPYAAPVAAFDAPGAVELGPDARPSVGSISNVHSLQRFISSSTDSTVDGACYSEFDDEMVPDASELDAYTDFEVSAHSPSRKTNSPVSSAAADSPDRKSRRSGRSLRPPQRAWSGPGTPMLKWEKEQQEKSGAGAVSRKRRAAAIIYAPPSRQQLGDDAYSDTASEAGSSTGSHSTITMDADAPMSDLGDDKPLLHTFSSPKRQHVTC